MDLEKVKRDLENDEAILLDVREQEEWDEEHLPSARLLPLSTLEKGYMPDDLPNGKMIYTHCRRGFRAKQAAQILRDRGFQATPLKPTFEELLKEDYPLGYGTNS
jgi:rhodanese-related sulfurtransferase